LVIPEPFAEFTKTVRTRAQVTVGLRAKPEDGEQGEEGERQEDDQETARDGELRGRGEGIRIGGYR